MPPREEPSESLIELLERLGLARREEIYAARHRARGLARDLPWFDSVWVDALVARRILTPFQAACINSGHGESLGIGPYVLVSPLIGVGYADRYLAQEISTRRRVWLTVCRPSQVSAETAREGLATLAHRLARIDAPAIAPIESSGVVGAAFGRDRRIWAASPAIDGVNVGQWTVRNGRWSPEVVMEIARQVASALVALETHNMLHGDISVANLFITASGEVRLAATGMRPVVRPEEGYAHADLPPEAFDYLAPERVADGTPVTRASDIYAFGCACWHLLTGRAPLRGGNSLGKLQAAHEANIPDVRRFALDVPDALAEAIANCLQADPRRRPASFARLAEMLGPSTSAGRVTLGRCLQAQSPASSRLTLAADTIRHSRHTPVWTACAAGCVLLTLAIAWPWWRHTTHSPIAKSKPRATPSKSAVHALPNTNKGAPDKAKPRQQFAIEVPAVAAEDSPATGVIPVTYSETLNASPVLELDADRDVDAESLTLEPGMIIRPANGRRARLITPPQGLSVSVDGVRFEHIDFVSTAVDSEPNDKRPTVVILNLTARNIELRGCTFRAGVSEGTRCKAIAWNESVSENSTEELAAAMQLRMVDCVLDGVSVGVDCPTGHPLLLEFDNTLHLGPGPLWRLNDCPTADRPVQVVLERVTIRDAVSLVDVRYDRMADEPGQMSIDANDCVLATGERTTLVRLAGRHQPDSFLRRIVWTGQGSLLGPIDRFAIWYDGQAKPHGVDDGTLEVDGLASGTFEFAGPPNAGAAASQITRWAAPLRSAEPPGIRPAPLRAPAP